MNTFKVKRSVGINQSPSISHTSIQGHSYSGHSAHHLHQAMGDTVDPSHIAKGVHHYIDNSEHDSHHDAERDHHWKDKEAAERSNK